MAARARRRARKTICAGCGKPIQVYESLKVPGDQAVDIRVGTVLAFAQKGPGRPRKNRNDDFRCKEKWGRMHLPCFLRAMESPDQFLVDLEGYGA